jgi:hypothetical protein
MGRREKLLLKILGGLSDANSFFDGLCSLLKSLGFTERVRGDHHIFAREGVVDCNLKVRWLKHTRLNKSAVL